MKTFLFVLATLGSLAAPAFADSCSAATNAATRSALMSAESAGRRTATVRVTCKGERVTLVVHRIDGPSGSTVTVREVKKQPGGQVIEAADKRSFSNTSSARLIRVAD